MDAESTAAGMRNLTVKLTLDDYYAFQRELTRRAMSRITRASPVRVALWLLQVVILFALLKSRAITGRDLLAAVVTCLLVAVLAHLWRARVHAQLAPLPDGMLLAEMRFELSEQRLRIASRHYENVMSWAAVRELRETPAHLFLMTDNSQGYVLPKRLLGDDAAIWALRSLIAQRITMGRAQAASAS